MKSVPLPSRAQLQAAYEFLQWSQSAPEPGAIVLWAHWARLDPRLAEILVHFLAENFRRINPIDLWEENLRSPQPQALAVLAEFAKIKSKSHPNSGHSLAFHRWSDSLLRLVPKAPTQFFFLREGAPKPNRDAWGIDRCLQPYLKWGFFGSESPLGNKKKNLFTILSRAGRLHILRELTKSRRSFSVKDYIEACGGNIHPRTAERDLQRQLKLAATGHTRSRRYGGVPARGKKPS